MLHDISFQVSPSNGAAARLVLALADGAEAFRDRFDVNRSKARESFAHAVAKVLGIDPAPLVDRCHLELPRLGDEADRAAAQQAAQAEGQQEMASDPFAASQRELEATPEGVKSEAKTLLSSPALLEIILRDIGRIGVAGERQLALLIYLAGVSRLLDRPVSVLVQGSSSSGKSFVPERVLSLFPSECWHFITDVTPQCLYYLPPGELQHRVLLLGERRRALTPEQIDGTRAIRELIETGRVSKWVPIKLDGRLQTVHLQVEGPTAIVQSSSHDLIADEDINRVIVVGPDESAEQTRRIVERIFSAAAGEAPPEPLQTIRLRHHTMQRMLQRHTVVIDRQLADLLTEHFPVQRLEARRAASRVVSLMQASALLHQFQRKTDSDGRLVATIDDYRLARALLNPWLGSRLGGGLSAGALRLWKLAAERKQDGELTTTELAEWTAAPPRTVRKWAGELVKAGLWLKERLEGEKANRYRPIPGREPESSEVLPDVAI